MIRPSRRIEPSLQTTQRNTTRWEPKSFRQTHGGYLHMDRPRLDFATKYGQKYGTSSSSCFIRR